MTDTQTAEPINVDEWLRHRLDRWAAYQSGDVKSGYAAKWPDRFYLDGKPTGRETCNGKSTRSAVATDVEEWPDDVIECSMAIRDMIALFGSIGAAMAVVLQYEHSPKSQYAEATQRARASMAHFPFGTYRLRLRDAYMYLAGKLT